MPSRSRRPQRQAARPPAAPQDLHAPAIRQSADVRVLFWMLVACLCALVYGLTPFTYNLDDIKVSILFCLFPLPLLTYFILLARGRVPALPRSIGGVLAACMAVMAVSALLTRYKWISFYMAGFTIASLGAFFGAVGVVRRRADLEKLVLAFICICAGAIFFGLLHRLKFFTFLMESVYEDQPPSYFISKSGHLVTSALHGLVFTLAGADREMLSTVLNRDFFAAYLNMTIPLALGLAAATQSTFIRHFCLATFSLGMLCILLTMSKNDYVIMLITPMLFVGLSFKFVRSQTIRIPNWNVWLIGMLVIFGTIIFLRWDLFSDKMKLFEHEQLSRNITSRWIIWRGAIGMFLDNPVFGAGPGTFRVLFPRYRDPDYFINDISTLTLSAHNAYLDYLGETGLLGFVLMMSFLGLLAACLLRQITTNEDHRLRALQAGIFCGYCGILLANLTSPFSRWAIGGGTVYALLGVVAATINAGRSEQKPNLRSAPPSRFRIYSACALAVAVAVFWLFHSFGYGMRYFRAAKENSSGLLYLSYEEPDLLKRGIGHFEKAVALNPTFITSYYRVASAYHSLSRLEPSRQDEWLDKSIATYRKLAELAPDYSEIHYNFGILYTDKADTFLTREREVQESSAQMPLMAEAEKYLSLAAEEHAEAARQSNKLSTQMAAAMAYEALSDALEIRSQNTSPAEREAIDRQVRSYLEKAAAIYNKLLKYNPNRPDVTPPFPDGDPGLLKTRKGYGMVLQRLGRHQEAAAQLQQFITNNPGDTTATLALLSVLEQTSDTLTTELILDEFIKNNPMKIDYRVERMRLYKNTNRPDLAQKEAKKILKLRPTHPEAMTYTSSPTSP